MDKSKYIRVPKVPAIILSLCAAAVLILAVWHGVKVTIILRNEIDGTLDRMVEDINAAGLLIPKADLSADDIAEIARRCSRISQSMEHLDYYYSAFYPEEHDLYRSALHRLYSDIANYITRFPLDLRLSEEGENSGKTAKMLIEDLTKVSCDVFNSRYEPQKVDSLKDIELIYQECYEAVENLLDESYGKDIFFDKFGSVFDFFATYDWIY